MKNHYVNATLELIGEGKDFEEIFTGLKKTLETKGHTSLYPSILVAVLRILEAKPLDEAVVRVTKEGDYSELKSSIEVELQKIAPQAQVRVQADDTLIGGYILEGNSLRLDKSYKNSLVKLYRKLTQN